jgi:hypothetical protein
MAKWDLARDGMTCVRRGCEIGQGEAFRVGKLGAICEDCSLELDGEEQPAYIEPRPFLDRIRDDIAQAPPRRQAAGPLLPTPASQPAFDPRGGPRVQRHGVVEAMREHANDAPRRRRSNSRNRQNQKPTQLDVWRRAAGERDE